MKAFLKRRWVLILFGFVISAFSTVTVARWTRTDREVGNPDSFTIDRTVYLEEGVLILPPTTYRVKSSVPLESGMEHGIIRSQIKIRYDNIPISEISEIPDESVWDLKFHAPKLAGIPGIDRNAASPYLRLPLWLLLSAVLGFLVIRELRWREKRAKAADACGANSA
jgi:hypothetical protein